MKQKEEKQDLDQVVKIDLNLILELVKKYPNDGDLGKEIRKYVNSKK